MFPGLKPHHIGWAVADVESATALFSGLGYTLEASLPDRTDPNFQVTLRFLRPANEGLLIELVAPTAPGSSVSAILKRSGPGPYHLGFRVDDLDAAGAQLAQRGFLPLSQPHSAPAFAGRLIRFWRSPAIGLIELILWP